MSFEQWMSEVDKQVDQRMGLCLADLPDCTYRDWYDDGVSPEGAADEALLEMAMQDWA